MDVREYAEKARALLARVWDCNDCSWSTVSADIHRFLKEPIPASPAPIRWTRKAPDKPGWWWRRSDHLPDRVLQAVASEGRIMVIQTACEQPLEAFRGGWWSDRPIPEPLPPEEEPPTRSDDSPRKTATTTSDPDAAAVKAIAYLLRSTTILKCDSCGELHPDDPDADAESCDCSRFKQRMDWATDEDIKAGIAAIIAKHRPTQEPSERPFRSEPPDVPGKWEWRYPPHPGSSTYRAADLAAINGKWNSTLEWRLIEALPEPVEHKLVQEARCLLNSHPSLLSATKEMFLSRINAALLAKRSEP